MRDLDLTSLHLFVAVCDLQNIARAAEQEHIVATAISKRIARLEQTVGVALLERGRRGVQPTAAGQALLEHARSMLFTAERLAADAASFGAGVKGHVRMVASASAIAESLLDDIAAFMRQPTNRNIKVEIEERLSRDIVRTIRDGTASVGICWDSLDFEGLEHRPYRGDRLALAVHADHPLARRTAIGFEQTLDYEHVGLQPSTAVHTMLVRAARRAGKSVSYRVIVSNFDAAFRVVAANLGISVVPVQVGAGYADLLGIRIIPLTDAWAQRRFAICFQHFDALAPAVQRVVQHLVASAAAGEAGAPIDGGRKAQAARAHPGRTGATRVRRRAAACR